MMSAMSFSFSLSACSSGDLLDGDVLVSALCPSGIGRYQSAPAENRLFV